MIVENKTNGKKLNCSKAVSPLEKIRGLMFRKEVIPILFDFFVDGIHAIHSFFVPAPFYAIYISSSDEVVDKFRVVPSEAHRQNSEPARYLLEIDEKRAAWFEKGDRVVVNARVENTK
ncbi:MAG: DUF192 domain-containing protein [bacterium]|nr:DUF192 domain-containing protein [bacterium]